MNPIPLLTSAVNDLWFWTYGIVAGWGVTVTLLIAGGILIAIKVLKLSHRVTQLETRLIHAERDYNLSVNKWKK